MNATTERPTSRESATDKNIRKGTATSDWVQFPRLAERCADPGHARGVLFALTAEGAERVRRQLEAER